MKALLTSTYCPEECSKPMNALTAFIRNLPLMPRVNYSLLANELVEVQPMKAPTGLLFYLDYQFDKEKK
jgi:hypothetical protein